MGVNAVLRFVVDEDPAHVFDQIAIEGLIAVRIEDGVQVFALLLFLFGFVFILLFGFVQIFAGIFGLVFIARKQRGVGAVLLVLQEPAIDLQQLLVRAVSGRRNPVVGDLLAHDGLAMA